jgi:hypothetical protein
MMRLTTKSVVVEDELTSLFMLELNRLEDAKGNPPSQLSYSRVWTKW